MTPLTVTVEIADGDWTDLEDPESLIARAVAAAARHAGRALAGEVAVRLSDDDEVAALNRAWRGKPAATNVLSFPAFRPPGLPARETAPLGDIVLAAGVVAAEAGARGIPLADHCAHLVIHGLLHLAGHRHDDDAGAAAMRAAEVAALGELAIADPYRDPVLADE